MKHLFDATSLCICILDNHAKEIYRTKYHEAQGERRLLYLRVHDLSVI